MKIQDHSRLDFLRKARSRSLMLRNCDILTFGGKPIPRKGEDRHSTTYNCWDKPERNQLNWIVIKGSEIFK